MRGPLFSPRDYLALERGTIVKDWGGRLAVAVIYPNSYYAGMSNLGIHALYRLLNCYSDVVAERIFWEGDRGKKLQSLESQRPLADFSILAFSISYELDYFNVVKVLKAAGIPIYASERNESHPLVIAGGAAVTANPRPMAPFLDCIGIGEAEVIVPPLVSLMTDCNSYGRDELLSRLALLPGVYVPRYHTEKPVIRQWLKDLNDFPVSSVVITPATELGNLYLIEVERGCNRGCLFCLVGASFCPMRYRSLDTLLSQAKEGLKYRRRIGLVGPAVFDHPQLEELVVGLRRLGAGLSISSLRVKPLSDTLLKNLAEGGVKTVAIAPEAGTLRLRQIIGKNISDDDIIEAVDKLAGFRIKEIKLYFMIGLPSENDEDAEAIINLSLKCKAAADKRRNGCRLSLNIAPFVPKAGTPFQWLPMASTSVLKSRLDRIKNALAPKGIKAKGESLLYSQIQAVLSRGDERLEGIISGMEELSSSEWKRLVKKNETEVDYYAHQKWLLGESLPWEEIDLGVSTGYLKEELKKAFPEVCANRDII